MQNVNMFDDLRHLSLGQVKTLEYGRYDINEYRFRTTKLEASCPLAATTNSGVVANGEDASGLPTDYNGVLQKIIEYMFGGTKELKVVFFECDWFDPINGTRVDDFGMVEVKHKSHYSGNNLLFAHQAQQVYYLSYPHKRMKHWWVMYKVNPKWTLVDMMHIWKDTMMMMSFMSIKKKMKDTKVYVSLYLTGRDSQN
jgi:hypothetical protein